jgi:hypothetical protein
MQEKPEQLLLPSSYQHRTAVYVQYLSGDKSGMGGA